MLRRNGRHTYGSSRIPRVVAQIRSWLPPLNFITLHYAYFITVCLVSSVIFWCSSNPAWSINYTDSLFLVVSAMTEAGLNTVNLSQMTTWQQTLLFLLIIFGSSIWVSTWTVMARKHVFEKRFQDIVRAERMRRLANKGGSTLTLPKLQRILSFGKASTIASPQQPAPPKRGGLGIQGQNLSPNPGEATLVVPGLSPNPGEPKSVVPGFSPNPGEGTLVVPATNAPDASIDAVMAGDAVTAGDAAPPERFLSPGRSIVFLDTPHPNKSPFSTASRRTPQNRLSVLKHRNGGERTPGDGEKDDMSMRHFLVKGSPGRNAQFYDLSSEEREELGGCEYRALKMLSVIVPVYFFLWQLVGCLALGAWINNNQAKTSLDNGINPWWLGIFNGVSAFNNSGMSLLDANMVPFQSSYFVLITMGLLILAGNTAYPIFLRLFFWMFLKLLQLTTEDGDFSDLKDTIRFILQYPRRVYTNLFPSRATWWLVFMLFLLNIVDWMAFELLNLGNPAIQSIPVGPRVLDGLFQSLAVRSGGFYVVPISSLYIGVQVLYLIMMYIAVYPVVITMRHSNVYEERSLGIYAEDDLPDTPDPEVGNPASIYSRRLDRTNTITSTLSRGIRRTFTWHGVGARPPPSSKPNPQESHVSFISQQINGQLAHDIWWLVLAILVIITINTGNFLADPINHSAFNVIFEVVSAYGCVGISVGLPRDAYSFCGSWPTAAKLVLCAVMLRGRHRDLPVALDRAVRLPGERLHHEEEEDQRIRRIITNQRVAVDAWS